MPAQPADLENVSTWVKYSARLCKTCVANCCRLPVETRLPDLVRIGVVDEFELDENAKQIAKRLKKEGVVEHFYQKKRLFTLTRMANGDCLFLDSISRKCTIYQKRPETCRNHPHIGPRAGFCAFSKI
jgi:Fe-S-cluster containining protein